jgi:hypothetical protein
MTNLASRRPACAIFALILLLTLGITYWACTPQPEDGVYDSGDFVAAGAEFIGTAMFLVPLGLLLILISFIRKEGPQWVKILCLILYLPIIAFLAWTFLF